MRKLRLREVHANKEREGENVKLPIDKGGGGVRDVLVNALQLHLLGGWSPDL